MVFEQLCDVGRFRESSVWNVCELKLVTFRYFLLFFVFLFFVAHGFWKLGFVFSFMLVGGCAPAFWGLKRVAEKRKEFLRALQKMPSSNLSKVSPLWLSLCAHVIILGQ